MTKTEYAAAVRTEDGSTIVLIPTEAVVLVKKQASPGQPWRTITPAGNLDGRRRAVVPVTESDSEALAEDGWSKALAQKLVRALDRAAEHEFDIDLTELEADVDEQATYLKNWVVDGRKSRRESALESRDEAVAEAEAIEAKTVLADDVRAGDTVSGSTHLLVPDAALGKAYVPRHIEGVKDLDLLDYAQDQDDNVLLYGPTQSGKTTLPIAYAAQKGLPCYSVSGTVALEPSQLFGKFVPNPEGGFTWIDGPVTSLVRHGGILVVDEMNTISPKIMTTLYPLLDSRREITLLDHQGEVIRAHKDLLIVATCNLGYQGTLPMSEALMDRFAHRHLWDYSKEVEDKLVKSKSLLELARKVRQEGEIRTPFSTSLLKAFERMATGKLGWDYAVANLLGRFTDPEDREAIRANLEQEADNIQVDLGLMEAKPKPKEEPKETGGRDWKRALKTWADQ